MPYERREYDRDFAPKPVEVGKEYDVEIQEISRRGGVARVEGLVVFVAGAKEGDKLRIKVTKVSSRFAEAEVVGEQEEANETE